MSSTTQPFRFFDLPPELRLMVYEQLHTPQHVVKQMPSSSESGAQVEIRYTTFAVGTLATCRFMHDEVQPFFNKAFKTGDMEMTHTFSLNDRKTRREAHDCMAGMWNIMHGLGKYADGTFDKNECTWTMRLVSLNAVPLHDQ